jgi:hypothetical protein
MGLAQYYSVGSYVELHDATDGQVRSWIRSQHVLLICFDSRFSCRAERRYPGLPIARFALRRAKLLDGRGGLRGAFSPTSLGPFNLQRIGSRLIHQAVGASVRKRRHWVESHGRSDFLLGATDQPDRKRLLFASAFPSQSFLHLTATDWAI